jgi:hypothetical protein
MRTRHTVGASREPKSRRRTVAEAPSSSTAHQVRSPSSASSASRARTSDRTIQPELDAQRRPGTCGDPTGGTGAQPLVAREAPRLRVRCYDRLRERKGRHRYSGGWTGGMSLSLGSTDYLELQLHYFTMSFQLLLGHSKV